jgi:hypothetical protein
MLPAISKQTTPLVAGEIAMRDGFCASILQLDPGICSVTQSTAHLLENAQRCRYEGQYPSISSEQETKFYVTDLADGYHYEFTGSESYYQITFLNKEGKLSVAVDNGQVDVVYLADDIAKLIAIQESSRQLPQNEAQYPVIRTAKPGSR